MKLEKLKEMLLEREVCFLVKNQEEKTAIFKSLEVLFGLENNRMEFDPYFPHVYYDKSFAKLICRHDPKKEVFTSITDFLLYEECLPVEFGALTSEYSALITKDGVVVGCQTIPLNKVLELAETVKNYKAQNDL